MAIHSTTFVAVSTTTTVTLAEVPEPQRVKLLTPDTPSLAAKFFRPGYAGTVIVEPEVLHQAGGLGNGRFEAAERGSYRKSDSANFSPAQDIKGVAGELLVRHLLSNLAAAGLVQFSALLGDTPDKSSDMALAGVLFDVKTGALMKAFPGLQNRDDLRLIVNNAQLRKYVKAGVEYLLFVFFESTTVAHLYVAMTEDVLGWELETAPWMTKKGGPYRYAVAADVLPLGQVVAPVVGTA